jgi:hypothetical protein
MLNIIRATSHDAGCWIEADWGQYGIIRVSDIARTHGWTSPLVYDTHQAMAMEDDQRSQWECEIADEAEAWLNAYVAPIGYSFGWHDGEFYLWSAEQWQEI